MAEITDTSSPRYPETKPRPKDTFQAEYFYGNWWVTSSSHSIQVASPYVEQSNAIYVAWLLNEVVDRVSPFRPGSLPVDCFVGNA